MLKLFHDNQEIYLVVSDIVHKNLTFASLYQIYDVHLIITIYISSYNTRLPIFK